MKPVSPFLIFFPIRLQIQTMGLTCQSQGHVVTMWFTGEDPMMRAKVHYCPDQQLATVLQSGKPGGLPSVGSQSWTRLKRLRSSSSSLISVSDSFYVMAVYVSR